jgi:HPt (histidine-containing phosphotransfer) domain-containing protein
MPNNPILNPESIQALRDLSPEGDTAFLRELIAIYLADTPGQLAQLESALINGDAALVIRAAHTIKGSSGNFGALELAQVAQEVESRAKASDLVAVNAILPEFKRSLAQVAEALKELADGT